MMKAQELLVRRYRVLAGNGFVLDGLRQTIGDCVSLQIDFCVVESEVTRRSQPSRTNQNDSNQDQDYQRNAKKYLFHSKSAVPKRSLSDPYQLQILTANLARPRGPQVDNRLLLR